MIILIVLVWPTTASVFILITPPVALYDQIKPNKKPTVLHGEIRILSLEVKTKLHKLPTMFLKA